MPKILIREKDNTSAGSLGAYTNYSVLIPGFSNPNAPKSNTTGWVDKDDNNVYELTTIAEFNNMIGEVPACCPGLEAIAPAHFGNLMARLLLDIGYTVLYVDLGPIWEEDAVAYLNEKWTHDSINYLQKLLDLGDPIFWDPFKDRAEYDFRFVAHGLLSTAANASNKVIDNAALSSFWNTRYINYEDGLTMLDDYLEANGGKFVRDTIATLSEADMPTFFPDEIRTLLGKAAQIDNEIAGKAILELNSRKDELLALQAAKIEWNESAETTIENVANKFCKIYDETDKTYKTNHAGINDANKAIANLAAYQYDETTHEPKPGTGRGDCTALIELNKLAYVNDDAGKPTLKIITAINNCQIGDQVGRFCACTVPSVVYSIDGVLVEAPGAMHYLECFASSLGKGYDEWFAAAGYSRGLSAHTVAYTTVRLGDTAVNALEPRFIEDQDTDPKYAVNVIACFRGNYYLWGNRTCEPLGDKNDAKLGNLTAKHFLNIRQLCTTLKKQIYVSCRSFTFDPNSDVLWINFCNAIKPTLERMKANQGIREYKIEKAFTDKKATLAARIRIVPIEAVEDFDIEISLEDSLGGMVVETVD